MQYASWSRIKLSGATSWAFVLIIKVFPGGNDGSAPLIWITNLSSNKVGL